MLVFFDESGDVGFKFGQGSSEFFTVTAVVFEERDEAQACDDRIALLRGELGKSADYEFHFTHISDPVKRAFFQAVAPFNFFFFSIVVAKKELPAEIEQSEAFYRWVCGLIFESVKPYLFGATIRFDQSGGETFRRQLATDLKRLTNAQGRHGSVKAIKFSHSKTNNLLQLADMICGAVVRFEGGKGGYYPLIRHRQIWVRRYPETGGRGE